MYNLETKRIKSRDIRWAPFERPTFYEELEKILKPQMKTDRKIIEYDADSNFSDENDQEDNLIQGEGSELDIESNNNEESIEENTQPQPQPLPLPQKQNPHLGMIQELQTILNPNFFTPQNSVRRPRTSTQINNIKEFIFNTSIISNPDTPTSIQEAINGEEKEAWKSSAKSEIENFRQQG